VTSQLDFDAIASRLSPLSNVCVRSAGPELRSLLAPESVTALPRGPYDAVFVIAEGVSASAVQAHAVPMIMAATARLLDWNFGPVVSAEHAGVPLGDEIGALMHAAMVVVLIGERAGPAAAERLSAYLTHAPQVGRHDVERHCVANIGDEGLSYEAAAEKLAVLMSRKHAPASDIATDDDASDILEPGSIDKLLDTEGGNLRSSKRR
jgi:ethanolamine ammonia-lyase small subunit